MKNSFHRKMQSPEYAAMTVSVLGFVALLLACLGIVGLVSYSVSQRTKEIGIRMALGAKPAHVLSIVMRQLTRPICAGVVVGLGMAAALSRLLRRELFGISNLDPTAYLAAIAVFGLAVTAAALFPASQACVAGRSVALLTL